MRLNINNTDTPVEFRNLNLYTGVRPVELKTIQLNTHPDYGEDKFYSVFICSDTEVKCFRHSADLVSSTPLHDRNQKKELRMRCWVKNHRLILEEIKNLSEYSRVFSRLLGFLKTFYTQQEIIFIDLPETHPSIKVRMARVLATLVHVGVKIVVSTNCGLFIKEISNLIMIDNTIIDNLKEEYPEYDRNMTLLSSDVSVYYVSYKDSSKVDYDVSAVYIDKSIGLFTSGSLVLDRVSEVASKIMTLKNKVKPNNIKNKRAVKHEQSS